MVFTDDNNVIKVAQKRCCPKMALNFVNKACDSPLNNLQI